MGWVPGAAVSAESARWARMAEASAGVKKRSAISTRLLPGLWY
jgi:hypothetical protein